MSLRCPRGLLLMLVLVGVTAPSVADVPAAQAPALDRRAEASFARFAARWIESQRRRHEKAAPHLRPGPRAPIATLRRIDPEYRAELRSTGRPAAPYVGVVHYTELLYTCRGLDARDCTLAAEEPQAAIFRYRRGRWEY